MPELRITLTNEEFDALSYVLARAYENALAGHQPTSRGVGEQISSDEPLPVYSPEDQPISPPSPQIIKTLEERLTDAWLG